MRNQWRQFLRRSPFTHRLTSFPSNHISKFSSFAQFPPNSPTSASNSSVSSSISRPNSVKSLVGFFAAHDSEAFRKELVNEVSKLRVELEKCRNDPENVARVLSDSGFPLLSRYGDGCAVVELLNQLYAYPLLAMEVFKWRRKHADISWPISPYEYSKGIKVAGRAKDVDYAVELFTEAVNNQCRMTSTYNSLMSVYMVNGLATKCQSLFQQFKKDKDCRPNIFTYNILISVFGRSMLIEHMEATLQEIHDSCLVPIACTFNNLIAGYLTAWMWDHMEKTYLMMKETSFGPNVETYKLMVRGYAHSGNLEKMEEMYSILKEHQHEEDFVLTKVMIAAYCKSSHANKVEAIDQLLKPIPESEYKPWFIVTLIQVYAQEKLLDRMENIIDIALKRNVVVPSIGVMRLVITAYFQHDAVDKLSSFLKRAECAGWRICRSFYHCKMIMYSRQGRLEEMENVLEEMKKLNIDPRTKKTLLILCIAYSNWGPKCKLEQLLALMWKLGYGIRLEKVPL